MEKSTANKPIDEASKKEVMEKRLLNLWWHVRYIIEEANEHGNCTESDEAFVYSKLRNMGEWIAAHKVSWTCRKRIMDEMTVQVNVVDSGFDDILVEIEEQLCYSLEEKKYLADSLSVSRNKHCQESAARIYLALGDETAFLEIKLKNLEYSSDYFEIVEYYENKGDEEQAKRYAIEGFKKGQGGSPDLLIYLFGMYKRECDEKAILQLSQDILKNNQNIIGIGELMYDYFKERNDYDNQKKMLLSLLECCNSKSVKKWYRECGRVLSQEDWDLEKTRVLHMVKEKNKRSYLDICMEKGENYEVLEILKNDTTAYTSLEALDSGHYYSGKLIGQYPEEILQLYWAEVDDLVSSVNSTNYRRAAEVLREVKEIMKVQKQEKLWQEKFNSLRLKHKQKKLFVKAIERAML